MFCRRCGNKNDDNAVFCTECGTRINPEPLENSVPKVEVEIKEGKITTNEGVRHKCPSCGELLKSFETVCPACNHEIRGRTATNAIQLFFEKISLETNEKIRIELIKLFPVPNNREDIIEFMLLASSNFDARYYATNKATDSISGAWLSKIDQCYKKGKIMFSEAGDISAIESIYNEVHNKTENEKKTKVLMTFVGIVLIVGSLILMVYIGESNSALSYIFMASLVIGIVILVKGLRKNKTNTQLEEEKTAKLNNKGYGNNQYYETNNQTQAGQQNSSKPLKYSVFNSSGRVVNKNIYLFLAITLGWAGAHRYYAGQRSSGLLYTFTLGLFGFGWIIDISKGLLQKPDTRGNIIV